jgi:uncharacterized protein (DUF2235 family)
MKRIILCADGTWNSPPGASGGDGATNVWKLYCAVPDLPDQLKFYDSGVGTGGTPIEHLTGGATGQGLLDKIQDLYSFLSHVYDPGDSVYLFGFSRGAFTARSVGGMIANFGVPTINLSNSTTPEIFTAYRQTDPAKRKASKLDLTTRYGLVPVDIAMVGVWDTVGALGIPGGLFQSFNEKQYGFLDTTLSDCVRRAYHAVSIDERRASFQPTLWTNKDGSYRDNDARCEQVWFTGVHCDVGGFFQNGPLAEITLGWMLQKAKECGITLTADAEAKLLLPPGEDSYGPIHDEWSLLKWGLARHRAVPAGAHLSNSVFLRAAATTPTPYRPTNLTFAGDQPSGYQQCVVVPYETPKWPTP